MYIPKNVRGLLSALWPHGISENNLREGGLPERRLIQCYEHATNQQLQGIRDRIKDKDLKEKDITLRGSYSRLYRDCRVM